MTETILFPLFIVLVAIAVTSTVALVVNSINSTHNYTYELLGTFIQNYNYIWDRDDSGYRTMWLPYLRIKKINLVNMRGT